MIDSYEQILVPVLNSVPQVCDLKVLQKALIVKTSNEKFFTVVFLTALIKNGLIKCALSFRLVIGCSHTPDICIKWNQVI